MIDITFTLIVPIILGVITGNYIDQKASLHFPIGTVSLAMLGMVVGMWSVYKRYVSK
jgi:hypothetical protein